MSKKDTCKEIMARLFGDVAAHEVDAMDEDHCVGQCKNNVRAFLGDDIAQREFSHLEG